jgi:hypothetical protein
LHFFSFQTKNKNSSFMVHHSNYQTRSHTPLGIPPCDRCSQLSRIPKANLFSRGA